MSDAEVEASQPATMQSQAKEKIDDIFGLEDSDDDDVKVGGNGGGKDDIADSDEDDAPLVTSKYKSIGKKTSKDSPSDGKKKKKSKKRKGGAEEEGRDGGESSGKKKKKKKKEAKERPKRDQTSSSSSAPKSKSGGLDDSDDDQGAYDSGEEQVANDDDNDFVAEEDDALLVGVVGEYDNDNQQFDDEMPDGGQKKKKKFVNSESARSKKPLGVFETALKEMKAKTKAKMSDADMQKAAAEILKQMDAVRKKDEACYESGEPALHKINLLKRVQDVVSVKVLQPTLLDYDILGVMADWLHIKADKSLPSHTVRTAVYQMLNQLPCETTHLKRNNGEHSKTIGMVVMELYKHKLETKDNKRVLRLLIEKWSRPIYKKNADARSAGFRENDDLKNARFEQGKEKIADSRAHDKSNDVDTALRSTVDSDAPKNEYNRAITPYSAGFIFTQRPEPKAGLHADKSHTSSMDSTREGLMKKMGAMKGVKGFGKKEVATTMDMAATGRNKFNI